MVAASCAVGAISASGASAAQSVPPGCPNSGFPYTEEFRFPPAPEGFAPDCTLTVGPLTIDADTGRPEVRVDLFGLGVVLDDRGRLAHFTLPSGPLFDVARRGRPLASVADSSQSVALSYNRTAHLSKVTGSNGPITLAYNSAGEVTKLGLGSGGSVNLSYGSSGHVVGYSDSGGDTGTFKYSAGHLSSASITLTAMDPSYSFTYNSGGKLISWSLTDTTTETSDFTLNSAGDVTAVTRDATPDASLTYTDPHVLSEVTASGGGTVASFTYNSRGRLATASPGSTGPTSFHYNPPGKALLGQLSRGPRGPGDLEPQL